MSNELPMSYNDMKGIAKDFVKSGLFAQFRNPEQALVTIMAGREFGLGPFEAITSMYVVQGKPSFYSHKFADMIKRSGKYNYKVTEHTEKSCTIEFSEKGDDDKWSVTGTSTFTVEDAEKADLLKNPNFKKYPRNMLYARAMTNGAKWYCPDAFHGTGAYEPSELGADVEWAEDGTQTVVNVPEPEVIVEETPVEKKAYKPEPVVDVTQSTPESSATTDKDGIPMLIIDTSVNQNNPDKITTKAADFEIKSFTELESKTNAGVKYGKITFNNVFNLPEGYSERWPDYNVAPYHFDEKPDMYRGLQSGDKVLAKLIIEQKKSPEGMIDKNYQNVEIIMKYPEDDEEKRKEELENAQDSW